MSEVRIARFNRDIQKNLFPINDFYKKSIVDPASTAETIEIPQALAHQKAFIGDVQLDYNNPANNLTDANALQVIKRVNTKKIYDNKNFVLSPTAVDKNNQDGELSYNKMGVIREEYANEFNTLTANYAAVQWAPTSVNRVFLTTGTQARENGVVNGYVGNVKRLTKEDLINVRKEFMKQNLMNGAGVANVKIWALITPEQWEDIMLIPELVDFEKTGNETMLKKGVIGKWLNIWFVTPRYNEDAGGNIFYDVADPQNPTKLEYTTVARPDGGTSEVLQPTANTVGGALFWHEKHVRRSEGRVNTYYDPNNVRYQADLISSNLRFGATISRLDEKGVIALIDAPAV